MSGRNIFIGVEGSGAVWVIWTVDGRHSLLYSSIELYRY
jgi:hypothetical protein